MKRSASWIFWTLTTLLILSTALPSCTKKEGHMAPAVRPQDSLPFMRAHGISNLISDSGIIRYKIVAEDWDIYSNPEDASEPTRWDFLKGIFLEKFDPKFHIEWYLQADTAYCHDQRLWELRGRVVVRNTDGTHFHSEELFWDMQQHEVYSRLFMRVISPDRELQGYNFRSNEQMTKYIIFNTAGSIPVEGDKEDNAQPDSTVMREPPTKTRN